VLTEKRKIWFGAAAAVKQFLNDAEPSGDRRHDCVRYYRAYALSGMYGWLNKETD
jgi:hypothetical protein